MVYHTFRVFALCLIAGIVGCGGDDPPTPEPAEVASSDYATIDEPIVTPMSVDEPSDPMSASEQPADPVIPIPDGEEPEPVAEPSEIPAAESQSPEDPAASPDGEMSDPPMEDGTEMMIPPEPGETMDAMDESLGSGVEMTTELIPGEEVAEEPLPPPKPASYLDLALAAFSEGRERAAEDLLLAHLVTEPRIAREAKSYQQAGWSMIEKRPKWHLRVGIGINTAAVKHNGSLFPIQENMQDPVDSNARSRGRGRGESPAAISSFSSGDPEAELDHYVGLVGKVAADMFAESFAQGDFGEVFAQAATPPPESEAATQPGTEDGQRDFDAEGFGMSRKSAVSGGGLSQSGARDGLPRLRPGLAYLGAGRTRELLEKAQEAQLDAFLLFDVSVSANVVNGWVYNDSSLRWILVSTGKPVGRASIKLKNTKVLQEMRDRKVDANGIVRDGLSGVFGSGMSELRLLPMPKLTESMAESRIGKLIVANAENPLPSLAEVRLYNGLGLLTDEQAFMAFDLMMGDNGLVLAAGPKADREELLQEKLPDLESLEIQ